MLSLGQFSIGPRKPLKYVCLGVYRTIFHRISWESTGFFFNVVCKVLRRLLIYAWSVLSAAPTNVYFFCKKITLLPIPLSALSSGTMIGSSQWRLILAVDYQFSTNLVPLVAAPAFVPLITPWLPLSPPAGYIRSALHITTRYISTIVYELTSLAQRSFPPSSDRSCFFSVN